MNINYEKDMEIEQDALDIEWLGQTALAMKYAKNLVHCHSKVRQLEEQKKTVRSELILLANKDPEKYLGKEKPNAADIEAFYRNSDEYKSVVEELNQALEDAEFAELAKNEISFTRKVALENLVRLHAAQYFAGPSVPRDLNKEWEKHTKQRNADADIAAAVNSKLKRRMK
jgi:hypothetical protein